MFSLLKCEGKFHGSNGAASAFSDSGNGQWLTHNLNTAHNGLAYVYDLLETRHIHSAGVILYFI